MSFENSLQRIHRSLLQGQDDYLTIKTGLEELSDLVSNYCKNHQSGSLQQNYPSEFQTIIKIFRDFSQDNDPRVRSMALSFFIKLYENGIGLDISLYGEFNDLLNDDYESVRINAMKLINLLSCQYKDCLVCSDDGEQIRIVDDAFAKICSMMLDYSTKVRAGAAKLLGEFVDISPNYLHQTLDKKLMSDLKKKKSAHQRHLEKLEAGEWTNDCKWAEDSPSESICPETINLMSIGSCGAFIHGLEDELLDIRMASLESLCKLAAIYPSFAQKSLDFLVDMFNDEIQEIRLKAIQCLAKISCNNIRLREDQIDIILSVLEDYASEIREALHLTLANCKLASSSTLQTTITALMVNLKRYPCDKESIWNCFRKLGQNNINLTLALVPELLYNHPFFRLPDNNLDDPEYLGVLILVFNAAYYCPTIIDLLEKHIRKHYFFVRGSYPHMVPHLEHLSDHHQSEIDNDRNSTPDNFLQYDKFFSKIFQRLENLKCLDLKSTKHLELSNDCLMNAINDLQKFSVLHSSLEAACSFFSEYLKCQISLRKIVSNKDWINTFLLPASQSSAIRSSFHQLLSSTFRLLNCFHGLKTLHLMSLQQTRIKAMALQLIAIIHGSNISALGLCDAFISELNHLKKLATENNFQLNRIIDLIYSAISEIDLPKPGTVARKLKPILFNHPIAEIYNLDLILEKDSLENYRNISMTQAKIIEPMQKSDYCYKFTAGYVTEIPFVAQLNHVVDIKNIKIKIKFPDQQNQLIQPRLSDFKLKTERPGNLNDYRLISKILISYNSVCSGPLNVEINMLLDFRDVSSSSLSTTQVYSSMLNKSSGIKSIKSEDNLVIEICKPIKIMIHPMKIQNSVL
ncbi:hypothetical protein QR98_0070120 [Sarcoptes scabiei]|nr:hypothetical protein QR98_0070120 [Sarcoptes scabiei]